MAYSLYDFREATMTIKGSLTYEHCYC